MLIVVLTVFCVAICAIVVTTQSGGLSQAPILGVTITENNGYVTFTHYSGETLKAGKYEIILDSKTIPGDTDFGTGSILTYEAENINHAAIVYQVNGGNSIIAEKYFGGSGIPVKKVEVNIIGFRTESIPSDDGKIIDDKYKIVYSSESKKGIIVELSGEYTDDVEELTVNIGDISPEIWSEKTSDSVYLYLVPVDTEENTYIVSGTVTFNDETTQEFNTEVYIPEEADLTFDVNGYAKYLMDIITKGENGAFGHGVYVYLTGGKLADKVNNYIIEVKTKDGKTFSTTNNKLKLDTGLSGVNSLPNAELLNKKEFYYIPSSNENNVEFPDSTIIVTAQFNDGGTSDPYTYIIEIPPRSPGYDDLFIEWEIYPYVGTGVHGFTINILDGTIYKTFPVTMEVSLSYRDSGDKITPLNQTTLSISNKGRYTFLVDNITHYGDISGKADVKFTICDTSKGGDIIVEEGSRDVDIEGVDDNLKYSVLVKGYNKAISGYTLSKNTNTLKYRGHGIIVDINDVPDDTKEYQMRVTIKQNEDETNAYELIASSNSRYISVQGKSDNPAIVFSKDSGGKVIDNAVVDNTNKLINNVKKGSTYYIWVGKIDKENNNKAFQRAYVLIQMREIGSNDWVAVYDTSQNNNVVSIPARDLITVTGYSEPGGRGLNLKCLTDLSGLISGGTVALKLEYDIFTAEDDNIETVKITKIFNNVIVGTEYKSDINSSETIETAATNVKITITIEGNEIDLYYYESLISGEGSTTNPNIIIPALIE